MIALSLLTFILTIMSTAFVLCPRILGLANVLQSFGTHPIYHRTHISRMHPCRLNVLKHQELYTVFALGVNVKSVPICMYIHCHSVTRAYSYSVVSASSTVSDVVEALQNHDHLRLGYEHTVYTASSLWQCLSAHQTMEDLGIGSLSHFHIHMRVLGGASKSNVLSKYDIN